MALQLAVLDGRQEWIRTAGTRDLILDGGKETQNFLGGRQLRLVSRMSERRVGERRAENLYPFAASKYLS